MIVRDRPSRWDLLFAVRGSMVLVVAPRIGFLMAVATIMVALNAYLGPFPQVDGSGFTVFGIALSLFLGFRNNAAYDRWWEARKLWGGLLADLRSLARDVQIFVPDEKLRTGLLRLALAFLHLHRTSLRRIEDDGQACEWAPELCAGPRQTACSALDRIAERIAEGHRRGLIEGFGARVLSAQLTSMAAQQAGSERIANTPLPYAYSLAIYRTTYLYCLLLPLALIAHSGWMTPVFVGIVAYMFLALAEVSEELSHPFGKTPNALPLDAICRAAEISLAPHLGLKPPPPLAPHNFYLS